MKSYLMFDGKMGGAEKERRKKYSFGGGQKRQLNGGEDQQGFTGIGERVGACAEAACQRICFAAILLASPACYLPSSCPFYRALPAVAIHEATP